jgi:hypothetical protein
MIWWSLSKEFCAVCALSKAVPFYAENFNSVEYILSARDKHDLLNWGLAEKADRLGEIRYSDVIAVDLVALNGSSEFSTGVFIGIIKLRC